MKRTPFVALIVASLLLTAAAPASAAVPAKPAIHASLLQKTTAKRFKRGVRRTTKKIRRFFRRAAGKH